MLTLRTTITLCSCILFLTAAVTAQEKQESYGIFKTRQQYYDFMGDVKREGDSNPELMAMVPMINDIVLMQPFGSTSKRYGTSDSTIGLLADESVRKELEMIDSQYEDLQQANQEIQQQFADEIRELDLSDMKSAVQQILALRRQSEAKLQATLLPHQMKRLQQLAARNQLKQRSLVDIITSDPMKSELEVSDKQARDLRFLEREIEKDLQQQILELRAKARKRLLAELKSEQRKRVEEIFGDDLEVIQEKPSQKR